MAFSPWFLEKAKAFQVAPDILRRAREAWAIATSGLNEVPPLPDMGDEVEVKPKKIKVKAKAKAVSPPVTEVQKQEQEQEQEKEKEKPKKRLQKKVAATTIIPIAMLVNEKPVEADTLEEIPVVVRELNGTQYYLDTAKSKVYHMKTGKYVGRWDSARELLVTDRRDSDA
jgi:hypothetical protein